MIQLQERHCPLCGPTTGKKEKYPANFSEEDLNETIFSARRIPDRRHFRMVVCNGCEMIYSDPSCDPGQLAALYKESVVNYDWQEKDIYQSYAPVLDRGLKYVQKRDTFVEVGGGRGFMLQYGAERNFETLLEVEPSADAEKKFVPFKTNSKFIRDVFVPGTLPPSSIDLICFFQMLDHVPNPAEFLKAVFESLKPGGVAVCVTHNTKALTAKILGEKSPIFDIEHTFLYNPSNMSKLFKKAGMETLEILGVPNRYPLKYWISLAPLPKMIKNPLLPLTQRMKFFNMRLNVNFGNFGIIARKPQSST